LGNVVLEHLLQSNSPTMESLQGYRLTSEKGDRYGSFSFGGIAEN
jgi:hypothetical protein